MAGSSGMANGENASVYHTISISLCVVHVCLCANLCTCRWLDDELLRQNILMTIKIILLATEDCCRCNRPHNMETYRRVAGDIVKHDMLLEIVKRRLR